MPLPLLPAPARRILDLARHDRAAARDAMSELPLDTQVELVCRAPVARRGELLDLAREPEALIPRMPEAELCFTIKAIGLGEAGWILEHATTEQLVAAVDLDAWALDAPKPTALVEWLDAAVAAGEPTLLRVAQALDPELIVLALRDRIEVWLKPSGDNDWEPPDQTRTLEGQFYWRARHEGDDLEALAKLMDALFREDYWFYFRMMQGTIWELDTETRVWAERWRTGRLEDLGFPPRDDAVLALYAHLPPEELAALPADARALEVDAWRLPVWQPELPVASDARHAVFRAAAELGAEDRSAFFYALLSLANAVAVADRMPLGEAESTPGAIERAAQLTSVGLEHLADVHGLPAPEILRRIALLRLYRIGANIRGKSPPIDPAEGDVPA
jgi:hypothetical protein